MASGHGGDERRGGGGMGRPVANGRKGGRESKAALTVNAWGGGSVRGEEVGRPESRRNPAEAEDEGGIDSQLAGRPTLNWWHLVKRTSTWKILDILARPGKAVVHGEERRRTAGLGRSGEEETTLARGEGKKWRMGEEVGASGTLISTGGEQVRWGEGVGRGLAEQCHGGTVAVRGGWGRDRGGKGGEREERGGWASPWAGFIGFIFLFIFIFLLLFFCSLF